MTTQYTYNRLGRTDVTEALRFLGQELTNAEKEELYRRDALAAIERLKCYDRAGKDKLIAGMAKGEY